VVVYLGMVAIHYWFTGSPDSFMVMFVAVVLAWSSLPFMGSYPLR
jgi:hypothetical protein